MSQHPNAPPIIYYDCGFCEKPNCATKYFWDAFICYECSRKISQNMKSLCKIEEPESDELDEIIEKDLTFCKHPESRGEVKQFSKNISKAYAKSVLDKLLEESFDTGLESDKSIYTQGANNANDFWKVKITKLKSEV